MKRALTVMIIVGFVMPLAISMFLASSAQPTQTSRATPNLESQTEPEGNNAISQPDSGGTDRSSEANAFSSEQPQSSSSPAWTPPPDPGVPPPDGAIYYGGEPPYGYLPTYNPKETGLPIIPLEPDA
jgi:hypothetical protein